MRFPRTLLVATGTTLALSGAMSGCERDDSTVLAADCSVCSDDTKAECGDTYSSCIQGGDDSATCQRVIDAFCPTTIPDGGPDAGDASSDAGDASSDAGDASSDAGPG